MSLPTLFLVGATHRTAPFGFREKLALNTELEATLAAELTRGRSVLEFAILNTCNRVEIYGVARDPQAAQRVAATFCSLRNIDPADFDRFGFSLNGPDAVAHLLRVASGLDSQILGETEIFGQVKRAYATAQTRQSAGPILNRLFQKAFQAAKHVRTTTGVTAGQVSIANVGVDLALNVFGDVTGARILLIGAGEMGEKSARAFTSRGASHVTIASRHFERAAALAHDLGATAVAFDERERQLATSDIIVCSTASPDTVLSLEAMREAMSQRKSRPLLLIDLAMPRDIDASVAKLENVFLYNLDDLARVAAENRQARATQAEAGRVALTPRIAALWAQLQLQLTTLTGESRELDTRPSELTAALRLNAPV